MVDGMERELSDEGHRLHLAIMAEVAKRWPRHLSDGEALAALLMSAGVFVALRNQVVPVGMRTPAADLTASMMENFRRGEAAAATVARLAEKGRT